MQNDRLRTENPGKLLVEMAIPAICAQLIAIIYNTVDRIYIGRMDNGTMAMAGIGLCMPIVTVLTSLTGMFGRGGSPLAAISLGKDDHERAEQYLGNSVSSLILISLLVSLLVLLLKEPILLMFGASSNTLSYASDYISVYLCGTIFVQLTVGMNYYITTQGFARTAMMTTMIGAVLNMILDPLFIFTMHMGIRGAALATVEAQLVSCIFVLRFLLGKKTKLRLRLKNMRFRWPIMKEIMELGLAPFFMTGSEGILQICFNMQAMRYGGDLAVSVMTILFSMFQFVNLPCLGIAQGSQPIVGFNYGAKEYGRVRRTLHHAVVAATVYSFAVTTLMTAFPAFFIRLFNSDPELVALGSKMLRIYIFGTFFIGATSLYQQTYTSLGDGKMSFFFAFLRKVILLIPFLYIFPAVLPWGIYAVVLAEPVSDLTTTICNRIYFQHFLSKKLADGCETES
jgi:putative MATE family efflux protein